MRLRRAQGNDGNAGLPDRHVDDIVELTRVAFIAEAIAIKQDLERIGIPAAVFESDAGGWAPHFAIEQGHRVMVRVGDLAQAHQLISDIGGQVAAEPSPSAVQLRKRRRHHGDA